MVWRLLDERNRGLELEENVYNQGQSGKLSGQLLSTFSSFYFGKQLFITTETAHLLLQMAEFTLVSYQLSSKLLQLKLKVNILELRYTCALFVFINHLYTVFWSLWQQVNVLKLYSSCNCELAHKCCPVLSFSTTKIRLLQKISWIALIYCTYIVLVPLPQE